MSLVNWEPLKEINILRQQMNRLFDEMIHPQETHDIFSKTGNSTWNPAIELKEKGKDIILKVQVPGIDTKDLHIQASENAVSIAGEYQEKQTSEEKGFYHSEFNYGKLQRIIPLPVNVKYKEVKAEIKDGVVTLTLPKAETPPKDVVKVHLTVQEKAREAMTQERLHEEHLQATMQERVTEELDKNTAVQVGE